MISTFHQLEVAPNLGMRYVCITILHSNFVYTAGSYSVVAFIPVLSNAIPLVLLSIDPISTLPCCANY